MSNPADLGIRDVGAALRSGAVTSVELTRACLDRIEGRDPRIGAFVHFAKAEALQRASAADAALAEDRDLGPLHGIPFAIKDVFDVAGWPVRFGCSHYKDRIATKSAAAVAQCLAAGAVPLGLVATYELATVGPDRTSLYPQPRNPWSKEHITGGSSSGSAAAVAAGMVRFALGSDTGGSVRSPAAYCGVAGFKPSVGSLSNDGLMPLAPSMDHVGIISASTDDVALVFKALTGSTDQHHPSARSIAYGRAWCIGSCEEAAIVSLMDDAASMLSLAGYRIRAVAMPDYPAIEAAAATILLSEQLGSHWADIGADAGHVGRMAHSSLKSGLRISEVDLREAQALVPGFTASVDALLATHDALIVPTTMTTAPRFSEFERDEPVWTAMRTIPFNLSGHPALSVPIGFHDGLPLGMQIIGARGADELVLGIGAAFEAATDHGAHRPYIA